jgi:hypothetical protein
MNFQHSGFESLFFECRHDYEHSHENKDKGVIIALAFYCLYSTFNTSSLHLLAYLPHHQQPPLPHLKIPIIITKAILLQPLVHIMMSMEFKAVAFAHQLLFRHESMGRRIQALFQNPPVMFQDQIDLADLGALLTLDMVTKGILTARVTEFLIGSPPDRGAAGKAGIEDRWEDGHQGSFCAGLN